MGHDVGHTNIGNDHASSNSIPIDIISTQSGIRGRNDCRMPYFDRDLFSDLHRQRKQVKFGVKTRNETIVCLHNRLFIST